MTVARECAHGPNSIATAQLAKQDAAIERLNPTMWCSTCHQDVPGVANPATRRLVCSRCQCPLTDSQPSGKSPICEGGIALDETEIVAKAAVAPPFRTDEWAARRHARELDRKLRPTLSTRTAIAAATPHSARRFDPPQNLFDQFEHATTPSISAPVQHSAASVNARSRTAGGQLFAWFVVFVSTIALAAGIGLISWSLTNEQMIYWNLALSLALGGQGGLIFGLVLVVSRLWRNSRCATLRLQEVHARLGELQHTADALTAMRSGGAPAFYAELVRGASPQMLLTNLKGQLDQLATRLGNSR